MIAEGRIALNGTTIDTPATLLSTLDGITVDGKPVAAPEPTRLFLYHKPTGLLVTEHDPAGRPTIYDRLPEGLPRLVPVGRLDLNTEGLLLLTTDGGFKRQLELPATGVERTYRARAYGDITQAELEDLIHGIEIDGIRYGQIDANLERRTGANVWIEMTLREGKNREVRRVLEHLGLQVSRLIRLRYGPFLLDDLPVGEIGEVRGRDIVEFRRTLEGGIPADAIKPSKPKPGFREPPRREPSDRPTRSTRPSDGPVSASRRPARDERPPATDRRPPVERGRQSVGRPSAPYVDGDRTGRRAARPFQASDRAKPQGNTRSSRSEDRSERPSRGAEGSFKPYATQGRSSRADAKPDGPRSSRGNDHGDRPARARDDAKPYDKRPTRPSRDPQGSSFRPDRSGGPSRPGGRGGRPAGGGSRPGRPGRPGGQR